MADVYADKFAIRRQPNQRSWRYAIARTVKSRPGRPSRSVVGIPKSALSLHGNIKTFNDTGDSGQPVMRNFCPDCGSPIMSDVAVMPELNFLKAGTLDDTSWLRPSMQIYCDSVQPWVQLGGELQSFPKMPG